MKEKNDRKDLKEANKDEWREERRKGGRMLAGTIIIIVGLGLLLHNLFPAFSFNYAWPLIIVAVGVYLIMRRPR